MTFIEKIINGLKKKPEVTYSIEKIDEGFEVTIKNSSEQELILKRIQYTLNPPLIFQFFLLISGGIQKFNEYFDDIAIPPRTEKAFIMPMHAFFTDMLTNYNLSGPNPQLRVLHVSKKTGWKFEDKIMFTGSKDLNDFTKEVVLGGKYRNDTEDKNE